MSELTIRANVDQNNNTVSKFVVAEKGTVTFVNDGSAPLTVRFDGISPLCEGGIANSSFEVLPGKSRPFTVCDGNAGLSAKYTAIVGTTNPEDPILLVESAQVANPQTGSVDCSNPIYIFDAQCVNPIYIFDRLVPILAGGIVAGLIAAYLVARWMRSRPGPR